MMSNNTFVSVKKRALLAHKEKILQELRYIEKRIEDERSKGKIEYYLDDASSDSDNDFCIADPGKSLPQLKIEQSKLQNCLHATQELTSLQILQSEVNILVNDPVITGEPPVKEAGIWREVTAECRIDLVPFSITFYAHKPHAKPTSHTINIQSSHTPTSYRGLNVVLVKAAHEAELSKSVLQTVVRPSDAVEVLRSYAEAYRSRRSTLASLATKYADSLYMEPLKEGGYLLKCANLLEMAWRLENKWSPIAPFHHRMKFDLEYMEEKYINIITQCHKQVSDPTISSDERTLILSKIIATCLEANPVSESAESDQEARSSKRRATLDQEIEEPGNKKKKEVMAPPKSLPKKAKVSKTSENFRSNDNTVKNKASESNLEGDKENMDSNIGDDKSVPCKNVDNREYVPSGSKSSHKSVENASKKVSSSKTAESENNKNTENIPTEIDLNNKNKKPKSTTQHKNTEKTSDNTGKINEPPRGKISEIEDKTKQVNNNKNSGKVSNKKSGKDVAATKSDQLNEETATKSNQKQQKDVVDSTAPVQGGKNSVKNTKISEKNNDGNKKNANENVKSTKSTKPAQSNTKVAKENTKVNTAKNVPTNGKSETVSKATEKAQKLGSAQKVVEKNANKKLKDNIVDISKKGAKLKSVDNAEIHKDNVKRQTTEPNDGPGRAKNPTNIKKLSAKNSVTNVKNKITTNKNSDCNNDIKQNSATKDDASAKTKISNTGKVTNNKDAGNDKTTNKTNAINAPKSFTEREKINNQKANSQENTNNNNENSKKSDHTKKSVLPLRMQNNLKFTRKSIGNIKAAVAKENGAKIKSKIPQKKLSPLNKEVLKKNPLRLSPRRLASAFNGTSSLVKQSIQKSTTNIPRLAKPMIKAK